MLNRKGICGRCSGSDEVFIVKTGVWDVGSKKYIDLCRKHNAERLGSRSGVVKSKRLPVKRKALRYRPKASGQLDMFVKIWGEREHFSALSGKCLEKYYGGNLWVNCFAHVLPKGVYRRFKLMEENIVLLTPHEHHLFDFSSFEKREAYCSGENWDWEWLYEKRDDLRQRYNKDEDSH